MIAHPTVDLRKGGEAVLGDELRRLRKCFFGRIPGIDVVGAPVVIAFHVQHGVDGSRSAGAGVSSGRGSPWRCLNWHYALGKGEQTAYGPGVVGGGARNSRWRVRLFRLR